MSHQIRNRCIASLLATSFVIALVGGGAATAEADPAPSGSVGGTVFQVPDLWWTWQGIYVYGKISNIDAGETGADFVFTLNCSDGMFYPVTPHVGTGTATSILYFDGSMPWTVIGKSCFLHGVSIKAKEYIVFDEIRYPHNWRTQMLQVTGTLVHSGSGL